MNRKNARENAFILLFEGVCKREETAEEIFAKAVEYRDFEHDDYVKKVFFGAYENARSAITAPRSGTSTKMRLPCVTL